jgi:hypothetical protein
MPVRSGRANTEERSYKRMEISDLPDELDNCRSPAKAELEDINRTSCRQPMSGFTTSRLQSSRRAVTTGRRAARMAGSMPPTSPMSSE